MKNTLKFAATLALSGLFFAAQAQTAPTTGTMPAQDGKMMDGKMKGKMHDGKMKHGKMKDGKGGKMKGKMDGNGTGTGTGTMDSKM